MRTRGQHQEGLPLLHASHHYGKTQEQFVSLADSSETMWWFLSSLGDTDFGCPHGCGTHFMQNKANSWVCLHNKSHYKNHEMQQTFPSGTQNAKLPLSSIPEETFLGAITTTIHSPGQGPKKFIFLQSLFYCFSSGRRTKEKSFEDAEGCHYIASI